MSRINGLGFWGFFISRLFFLSVVNDHGTAGSTGSDPGTTDGLLLMAASEFRPWSVGRSDKQPPLDFLLDGLRGAGCRMLFASEPNRAPIFVTCEARQGIRFNEATLCRPPGSCERGSIPVTSTATGWFNHEGDILRYVFFHSIALAALAGVGTTLQAYVWPFTLLVIH